MEFILSLTIEAINQMLLAFLHNWPYLLMSVIIAVLLKLYVNAEKVSAFLNRHRGAGVVVATAAAVGTPLCSCGTTAVVLGMVASTMPWAPIVAFMVSSPLSSPEGLVYSAGLFGWPFAIAFYLASILLGLAGGWITGVLDNRGWLVNQTRFANPTTAPCACSVNNEKPIISKRVFTLELPVLKLDNPETSCGCTEAVLTKPTSSCGCGQSEVIQKVEEPASGCACTPSIVVATDSQIDAQKSQLTLRIFFQELYADGKRLLVMFAGFAFIGYFLNGLIPTSWVMALFGSGNIYNVPLAATLGLPFYINSEASLPLIRAMLDNGMSQGAALAFMISGAGTSIGAITGALTIARWRVIGIVVGTLWVGAIISGILFNLIAS